MTDETRSVDAPLLSDRERIAVSAILSGRSLTQAARVSRVDRGRLSRLCNTPGPFRDLLTEARGAAEIAIKTRVAAVVDELLADAVGALKKILGLQVDMTTASSVVAGARMAFDLARDLAGPTEKVKVESVADALARALAADPGDLEGVGLSDLTLLYHKLVGSRTSQEPDA